MKEHHSPHQYGERLREVYYPLVRTLEDNSQRVRIGPEYRFQSQQLTDTATVMIPYFLLDYRSLSYSAHDAPFIYLIAQLGNTIVGHSITKINKYRGYTRASDKGRSFYNSDQELALMMELTRFQILETLSRIHGQTVEFTFQPRRFKTIAEDLGIKGTGVLLFEPFDDKELPIRPYAATFDEMQEVVLTTVIGNSDLGEYVTTKAKTEIKVTDVSSLRREKRNKLEHSMLPAMRKRIGLVPPGIGY